MKGDTPRMKNSGRSGIKGKVSSRRREERSVSVRRSEVCVDWWVMWGVRGETKSYASHLSDWRVVRVG